MITVNQQPTLKKVEPAFGSSIVLRNFSENAPSEGIGWHFHPEIELVYIEEGEGKRHIGNHMSNYDNGDLLVIGSNVPHYGFKSYTKEEGKEIVLQVHESCFGVGFLDMVELSSIKKLFSQAQLGLSFHSDTKREVGRRLKEMFYMSSFERIIELIKIFHILSLSDQYNSLDAKGKSLIVNKSDFNRIEVIYDHVRKHFAEAIHLDEVSSSINMTTPAFCRFFKRSTGKTFVQFLNEFRIAHACNLIAKDEQSISNIAFDCGFNNISNFNRAFKKITNRNPSDYKRDLNKVYVDK